MTKKIALLLFAAVLLLIPAGYANAADSGPAPDILARTREQVTKFVKVFSDMRCTEQVTQSKLGKKNKVVDEE